MWISQSVQCARLLCCAFACYQLACSMLCEVLFSVSAAREISGVCRHETGCALSDASQTEVQQGIEVVGQG